MEINIQITKDGKLSFKMSEQVSIETMTQALLTVQLNIMKQMKTVETTPQLYDMFNIAAGNLLQQFAPEFEPTLTEQAVLEAENQILEKHYKEATPEAKQRAKELKNELLSKVSRSDRS